MGAWDRVGSCATCVQHITTKELLQPLTPYAATKKHSTFTELEIFLMQTLHLAIVILCQIDHYVYLHHSIPELMGKYIYTYTVNTSSLGPNGDITVRFFRTQLIYSRQKRFNSMQMLFDLQIHFLSPFVMSCLTSKLIWFK